MADTTSNPLLQSDTSLGNYPMPEELNGQVSQEDWNAFVEEMNAINSSYDEQYALINQDELQAEMSTGIGGLGGSMGLSDAEYDALLADLEAKGVPYEDSRNSASVQAGGLQEQYRADVREVMQEFGIPESVERNGRIFYLDYGIDNRMGLSIYDRNAEGIGSGKSFTYSIDHKDNDQGGFDLLTDGAMAALSFMLTPAVSQALSGTITNATTNAMVTQGIVNSTLQLASTGELDFGEALKSAAMAGLTTEAYNYLNDKGYLDDMAEWVADLAPEDSVTLSDGSTYDFVPEVINGESTGNWLVDVDGTLVPYSQVEAVTGFAPVFETDAVLSMPDWMREGIEGAGNAINAATGVGSTNQSGSVVTTPTTSTQGDGESDNEEGNTTDPVEEEQPVEDVIESPVTGGTGDVAVEQPVEDTVQEGEKDVVTGLPNIGSGYDPTKPTVGTGGSDTFEEEDVVYVPDIPDVPEDVFPGQEVDNTYDDGEDPDTVIVPDIPPAVEEPPTTVDDAAGGGGMLSGNNDGFDPLWTDLFPYTKITPAQAKALQPYKDYIAQGRGMFSI